MMPVRVAVSLNNNRHVNSGSHLYKALGKTCNHQQAPGVSKGMTTSAANMGQMKGYQVNDYSHRYTMRAPHLIE